MGKTLIYLLCSLFLLTLVSSQPWTELQSGGLTVELSGTTPIKQNQDHHFHIHVINDTNFIDNNTASCKLTITNSSGFIIYTNNNIAYHLGSENEWGQTLLSGNFSETGGYNGVVECNTSIQVGLTQFQFEVTPTGTSLSTSQSILYGFFLTLLVLTFISCFIAMRFLPARNERDEEGRILSITYLKYFRNVLAMVAYFLFIGINYITSNLAYVFMGEELVANTLFMIFKISFGIAPLVVILWLVWIIVSMFHDRQFQKLLNRGMFPGGNV